jgi:hypothetical protein
MATALGFPEIHQALAFLISWPALEKAAQLVLRRAKELNGNHYEVLSPAADALAGKHPLSGHTPIALDDRFYFGRRW